MKTQLVAVFLALLCSACSQSSTEYAPPQEEITIKYGEAYQIPNDNLRITFADATDSRCPLDAVCIWQGNGAVDLFLAYGRTEESRVVNTTEGPRTTSFAGYHIELKRLDPYPRTDVPIRKEDYVVAIAVRRE